jgi:hypothetical protein
MNTVQVLIYRLPSERVSVSYQAYITFVPKYLSHLFFMSILTIYFLKKIKL